MVLHWMYVHVLFAFTCSVFGQQKLENRNKCDHPECYVFAAEVAAGIDKTQDPCQDFWEYTCGNWAKKISNPDQRYLLDVFWIQHQVIYKRLKEMLTPMHPANNEPDMIKNAIYMYHTCLYPDYDNNFRYINESLKLIGGWHLGSKETFQWQDVMELMKKLLPYINTRLPLSIDVQENSTMNNISHPMLKPPDFTYKNLLPANYPPHDVVALALELNSSLDAKQAHEDAMEMIKLRATLEKIANTTEDKNVTSFDDFNAYTKTNWLPLLNLVFADTKNFSGEDLLFVQNIDYYPKLVSLTDTSQGAKSLMNYIVFLYLYGMLDTIRNRLPLNLSKLYFLRNVDDPYDDERWQPCLEYVMACYDKALSWKYGKLYHDIDEDRKMVNELTNHITRAFRQRLEKLHWLDETSRKTALYKLKNIERYYEYPYWIDDVDLLTKYYANLSLTDNIVANTFLCNAYDRKTSFSNLVLPPRKKTWPFSPLDTNAFYSPEQNNINILEGILQQPMFAPYRLRIMNFAMLGFVIGHEITHGFDNSGVQYDAYGNMIPWLSEQSQWTFDNRTQCLIDQYDNFTLTPKQLPGLSKQFRVNGTLTLGENIADHGGVRLAYDAYQKYVAENGAESMPTILKEKNFTDSQIFFLFIARSWCAKYTYNEQVEEKITDEHSPDKFRVNGPLSNFKEFSDAFYCPSQSPMNRGEDACEIW